MKKIISVVGARPNFMKMAPLHKELQKHKNRVRHIIVHTGQHYDRNLSGIFFRQLELSKPDINLNAGSGSHAEQTAQIMIKFEKIVLKYKPDLVIVYGDVNSTLAASVVCSKTLINGKPVPVAHVEAGLRSFDYTMPEEINRIVTDSLADYLFVPEESGMKNLIKAGISRSKIFFTGNIMIDSLKEFIKQASKSKVLEYLSVSKKEYVLVTLHRPSNVDSKQSTLEIIDIFKSINRISGTLDIVFPVHPRTMKMFENFSLNSALESIHNLILTEPLGYIDFLSLIHNSKFVITDSGGIQEETSYLGIPCLTIRDNTERPVTITRGTNILCGKDKLMIEKEVRNIINGRGKKGGRIKYYDGKTAGRIAKIILKNILSVY